MWYLFKWICKHLHNVNMAVCSPSPRNVNLHLEHCKQKWWGFLSCCTVHFFHCGFCLLWYKQWHLKIHVCEDCVTINVQKYMKIKLCEVLHKAVALQVLCSSAEQRISGLIPSFCQAAYQGPHRWQCHINVHMVEWGKCCKVIIIPPSHHHNKCQYDRLNIHSKSNAHVDFVSLICVPSVPFICLSAAVMSLVCIRVVAFHSLSNKHPQLSAVRDVRLFMMTIGILFVMIALYQHSTLHTSQCTISDIFPPSGLVLLLLSGLPAFAPPLLTLSTHVQVLHLSTKGKAVGQALIFFNTGC